MKYLKKRLAPALIMFSLMLPWATTEALEFFEKSGHISKRGISSFVIAGQTYRIAPGAKLQSDSSDRRQFTDFRKGDQIYFKGKILNDTYYVDIIVYEKPDPS